MIEHESAFVVDQERVDESPISMDTGDELKELITTWGRTVIDAVSVTGPPLP